MIYKTSQAKHLICNLTKNNDLLNVTYLDYTSHVRTEKPKTYGQGNKMYVVKFKNQPIAYYTTLTNAINYVKAIGGFGNNRISIVKETSPVVE